MMKRKVYKFATGDEIPEGAQYLTTVVQEDKPHGVMNDADYKFYVWHYFLVETDE